MRGILFTWLVLCTGCQACEDFGQGVKAGFKQEYDKTFKDEFEPEFVKSCTNGAVEQGAPREAANAHCACLARELLARNAPLDITRASLSPEGPEFQGMLEVAAAACSTREAEPKAADAAPTAPEHNPQLRAPAAEPGPAH